MNHAVNVAVVANPEWQSCETAKRQGKVRFTGISGHGGYLVDCVNYALDHDSRSYADRLQLWTRSEVLRKNDSKTRLDSYAEELPKAISAPKTWMWA